MKHEHHVCPRTESSPFIEAAPFAVFARHPVSPSALPSSGSSRGAQSCQHSSSHSRGEEPCPAQSCATELQLPPSTVCGSCELLPVHPGSALLRATPWASLPLQILQLSAKKQRWIAQSRVPPAHCSTKARFPPHVHIEQSCVCPHSKETLVPPSKIQLGHMYSQCMYCGCWAGVPKNAPLTCVKQVTFWD